MVSDEAIAMAEHEREAECEEQQAAQAGVNDALHQYVDGLAGSAEAGLQHGESNLHAENKKGRNQRPNRVKWIDDVGRLHFGVRGSDNSEEQSRGDRDNEEHGNHTQSLARE